MAPCLNDLLQKQRTRHQQLPAAMPTMHFRRRAAAPVATPYLPPMLLGLVVAVFLHGATGAPTTTPARNQTDEGTVTVAPDDRQGDSDGVLAQSTIILAVFSGIAALGLVLGLVHIFRIGRDGLQQRGGQPATQDEQGSQKIGKGRGADEVGSLSTDAKRIGGDHAGRPSGPRRSRERNNIVGILTSDRARQSLSKASPVASSETLRKVSFEVVGAPNDAAPVANGIHRTQGTDGNCMTLRAPVTGDGKWCGNPAGGHGLTQTPHAAVIGGVCARPWYPAGGFTIARQPLSIRPYYRPAN